MHGSLGTESRDDAAADTARNRLRRGATVTERMHVQGADLLLDLWVPVPSVLVVGVGAIGDALAAQAALLGWTARRRDRPRRRDAPPSPASPTPTCSSCSTTTPPSTPC